MPFSKISYHTQGRHGEFEPGKAQYSTPNLFDRLILETQNLGKAKHSVTKWS